MNIFVLDHCPKIAASYYVDKHVVKMPLEIAQLLCTTLALEGIETPYKKTHQNHPCAVWVRASLSNWNWLIQHGIAVSEEYTARYGKRHKSQYVIEWCAVANTPNIPEIGLTAFAQVMPDEFKHSDVVEAYRAYYRGAKVAIATWKITKPNWYY